MKFAERLSSFCITIAMGEVSMPYCILLCDCTHLQTIILQGQAGHLDLINVIICHYRVLTSLTAEIGSVTSFMTCSAGLRAICTVSHLLPVLFGIYRTAMATVVITMTVAASLMSIVIILIIAIEVAVNAIAVVVIIAITILLIISVAIAIAIALSTATVVTIAWHLTAFRVQV